MVEEIETLSRLMDTGVVAVVRTDDPSRLVQAAEALKAGGIDIFEVTMTVPGALDVMREVSRHFGSEVVVGAGTVLDGETAQAAILAGADFIVSPTFKRDLITVARRHGKVVVPGALTPTEILTAWEAGAHIVKVFPARQGGPRYVKDLLAPLSQLRLMPTGGVSLEDAVDYVRAGAVAVGLGSALVDRQLLAEGRLGVLTERAQRLIGAIQAAKS